MPRNRVSGIRGFFCYGGDMKQSGTTDQRILSLSFGKFQDEFGFKPDDKIEQRYFATHGIRLTDPEAKKRAKAQDQIRKAAAERRKQT